MSKTILSNIAISLSGGGYRAAAFHLGTLSFLDFIRLPNQKATTSLLDATKVISTISGGTITGVMWAQSKYKGEDFSLFYQRLYKVLKEDQLLNQAFEKLNTTSKWTNQYKATNLINSFSEVYNDHLFEGANFEIFLSKAPKVPPPIHVVFNGTEFNNGLAFRFQNSGDFGNGQIKFPSKKIGSILLGDIVAASSCFPIGFEPLRFPNDFVSKTSDLFIDWFKKYKHPAFVMDGGIIDNQGIRGVKLADERIDEEIDLYIISDVEGKSIKPLVVDTKELPAANASFFRRIFSFFRLVPMTPKKLDLLMRLLFSISLGGTLTGIFKLYDGVSWQWITCLLSSFFFLIVSFLLLIGYELLQNLVYNQCKSITGQHEEEWTKQLTILRHTPITTLKNLLVLRGASSFKMINEVFMKHIRRLQYNGIFEEKGWRNKVIQNSIYMLKKEDNQLSDACNQIIERANDMPTTLWFRDVDKQVISTVEGKQLANPIPTMLDCLIITGQLSICSNLMGYVDKLQKSATYQTDFSAAARKELSAFRDNLKEAFRKFEEDPGWLQKMHC